jgi:hypothetical protein
MVIQTAEGKRSIDDDLVLCVDQHRNEGQGGSAERKRRSHENSAAW